MKEIKIHNHSDFIAVVIPIKWWAFFSPLLSDLMIQDNYSLGFDV